MTLEELALVITTIKTAADLVRETATWLQTMRRTPKKARQRRRRKRR